MVYLKTSTDDADSSLPVDVDISVSLEKSFFFVLLNLINNFQLIIRHPDYLPRFKYNDIALLKLDHDVTFSEKVWPACVYPHDDYLSKTLKIAGFGRNDLKDCEF